MKYYVVADVHGYLDLLKAALQEAGFFDETEPCKLIVCGDLLDRGPQANEMVAFLMELMKKDQLIYILGNHEDLLVQCLQEIASGRAYEIASGASHHYRNKTWNTLLQLSGMNEIEAYYNFYELIRRVRGSDFYQKLLPKAENYYETEHYIFTHGWIPCIVDGAGMSVKYRYDPNWRDADIVSWESARWMNGMNLACKHRVLEKGKTIVCGHFHTSYGHAHINHSCNEWGSDADFSPFKADGILAIDACTAYSKKVNCIVIED